MLKRRVLVISFAVLSLVSSRGRAQQPSDSELFAQGRVALDQYKDCSTAKNAFEAESANAQDSAIWLDYAARASECAGFLDVALSYYERESKKLPGTARLIDKIGDLRYRIKIRNDKVAQEAAQRAQQDAQQAALRSASGPSLEETLAYINSHAIGTRVSVSFESNSLTFQRGIDEDCNKECSLTFYTIYFKEIQNFTIYGDSLACGMRCINKDIIHKRKNKLISQGNNWVDGVPIGGHPPLEGEELQRLTRAYRRLLALVTQQYEAEKRQKSVNDPFN